ncbi:DnaJ like chaperone protein [Draconibacterium orientale]|uniref:DnaJ like chaperone protein n=1 Tax=Draconibacterium orientale TaxID=1168034 RepID=X5DWV8_9BACT|nr:TerB family tellurite resistance protein [Draconibacterium orientale]AHW58736.1 molecular chaperone DnaJ [Draconibacterium orientale]SEU09540.1 DnaJ like chaperone protein [Draconibacterium orientale]
MAKFGKWIGAGLGAFAGGPIGAIIGFTIGSMFDGGQEAVKRGTRTGYSGRTTTGGYVMSLLVLVAAIMKADGKVLKSELDYVKRFMVHNFGEDSAQEAIKMLRDLLQQTIPVNEVCQQIKVNMNYSARLQLVHFLFGIAQADGQVDVQEQKLITHICNQMGIGNNDFESIQAMFVPNTDGDYKILEIERSASNDDVKKAYRRMAMKYHPDKVSTLGDEVQNAAKEKFQKVNQAYENIKKERKIA